MTVQHIYAMPEEPRVSEGKEGPKYILVLSRAAGGGGAPDARAWLSWEAMLFVSCPSFCVLSVFLEKATNAKSSDVLMIFVRAGVIVHSRGWHLLLRIQFRQFYGLKIHRSLVDSAWHPMCCFPQLWLVPQKQNVGQSSFEVHGAVG